MLKMTGCFWFHCPVAHGVGWGWWALFWFLYCVVSDYITLYPHNCWSKPSSTHANSSKINHGQKSGLSACERGRTTGHDGLARPQMSKLWSRRHRIYQDIAVKIKGMYTSNIGIYPSKIGIYQDKQWFISWIMNLGLSANWLYHRNGSF